MYREDSEYEYDYHDLADNCDELADDECYYKDSACDEPWMGLDDDGDEAMDDKAWENYYHNIADEIADD